MDPELPFDSLKEWLKTRWMETYDQVLIQHGYTEISDILECSPDDILSIIKLFKKKGHRLKMRLMIEDLRENYGPYKTQKSSKAFDRQFETTITNDNLEIAPKDDPASVESAGFFSAKKVEVNNTKDVSVSVPEIKFKKENYLTNTQNNVEITEHIEDGSAFKFTDSKVHSDEIKSSIDEEMKDGRISTAYSESPELPEFDVDEELLEIRRSVSTAPKLEKSSSEDEKDMIEEMISEDFVTPEDQNVNSLPEAEEVKSNATGVDLHKNEENLKKLPPVIKPKPNFNKEMGLNPGPIVDKRASLAGIKSEQQGQPAHNSTIRAMQQKLFMEQDKVSKSVNSSDRPITVNKIDMKKFNLPLPQTLGKKKLSPKGVEKTTPEENAPEIVSSSPFIDTQANLKKEDIFATMSNFPGLYGAGLQTMTIGNRPALKKKPFISSSHLKDSPSKAEKPKSAHMVHRYTATEQDMAILKSFRKQDLEEDAVISGNIQITRSKADRTLITKKPYWIIIHDFSIFWFNNNKDLHPCGRLILKRPNLHVENEEGLEFITITYKDNVIIFHFNTPEEAEEWSKKIKLVKLRNVDPLESISERESSTFSPSDPSDFRAETNSLPPPPPDMDDTLVDGEDFAPPPQPEEIVKEPKSRTEASRRVVSYDKDFILAAQKLLLRGEKFVKYKHGRPKKRTIWVPVELDRIYWGSNDKLKAKGFIEIKEIEDIIDGCRGASKQGLAFSIVTPNRTLELEAYSTNMKKNWISAIRYAVDRLHSSG